MTFDPFRPDDAGDESASYHPKPPRSADLARLFVTGGALALLAAAAAVAVLVA